MYRPGPGRQHRGRRATRTAFPVAGRHRARHLRHRHDRVGDADRAGRARKLTASGSLTTAYVTRAAEPGRAGARTTWAWELGTPSCLEVDIVTQDSLPENQTTRRAALAGGGGPGAGRGRARGGG